MNDQLKNADKILELHTESISVIIKGKRSQPFFDNDTVTLENSSVYIDAQDLRSVKIFSANGSLDYSESLSSPLQLNTLPLFFENTDYEIIIQSHDKEGVTLWHDDADIRDKISPVSDSIIGLVSGVINFKNNVGFSDFKITHNKDTLIFRIEVFPSRISYKEDYKLMLEDIFDEIYSVTTDFLKNTYTWLNIEETEERPSVLFSRIIEIIFNKYLDAANTVANGSNSVENQFAKFLLKSSVEHLAKFSTTKDITSMKDALRTLLSSCFEEVDEYKEVSDLGMSVQHRELYKYHLILKFALSVNSDIFKVPMKDISILYEYWCFIKLVSILKKQGYTLLGNDVITVDRSGVRVDILKGSTTEVCFINPKSNEKLSLVYDPTLSNMPTVNQSPDIVLILEKGISGIKYKYVFDTKYRLEAFPHDYYPDANVGPRLDDINTMHRYRDAIVYDSKDKSSFVFKKEMFGAYLLFPYSNEEKYEQHHFYKSIDAVNIGGLPFLPGTTRLVEKLLNDLISDSEQSAFERATMPRGIEKRLSRVDWSCKDALVGSVASKEQFLDNIKRRYYYVPANYLNGRLPIRHIALYQSSKMFGDDAGIRYYGEVIEAKRLKRNEIKFPSKHKNDDAVYYAFLVNEWKQLPKAIDVKDEGVYGPRFTNLFLLQNCTQSYELFSITSEEQYRLLYELKRIFKDDVNVQSEGILRVGNKALWMHEGCLDILDENSKSLITPPLRISDFSRHPRRYFNMIADKLKK